MTTEPQQPKKKQPASEPIALSAVELINAITHDMPYTSEPAPATLRVAKGKSTLTVSLSDERAARLQAMNTAALAARK